MPTTAPLRSLLSVLVASAMLAACGGTDAPDTSSATSETGPSVEFVDAVDPVDAVDAVQKAADASIAAGAVRRIPDRYIVTFTPGAAALAGQAQEMVRGFGGTMHFNYSTVLSGFAATLPLQAVEALRRMPWIGSIEADQVVTLNQSIQTPSTWGLDRSDQRAAALNGGYQYSATGAGVYAYIIDTGILPGHVDLAGRVLPGWTAIADGNDTSDCNGHGTHVAGTVGGATWGVAKATSLIPVRVLDCNGSGSLSSVINGMDYAARDTARRPAVANLSLGSGASTAVDAAVANLVAAGVTVVVAAGNSNANACNYSPARAPQAITVGATATGDARSSFSNFGACVDLFAPGTSIQSAWHTSTTATNTISGTSMAAPHVAGAAALVLEGTSGMTPTQVTDRIRGLATANAVASAGTGSPNLLLFTNPTNETQTRFIVSVKSMAGAGVRVTNGWRATVRIAAKGANGAATPAARITGGFTAGGTPLSCTTDALGECTITTATLNTRTLRTTFTVTGISGTGLLYDTGGNAISPVSVTVARP